MLGVAPCSFLTTGSVGAHILRPQTVHVHVHLSPEVFIQLPADGTSPVTEHHLSHSIIVSPHVILSANKPQEKEGKGEEICQTQVLGTT